MVSLILACSFGGCMGLAIAQLFIGHINAGLGFLGIGLALGVYWIILDTST